MSSFLYTTKHAKPSLHALPSTLNKDDVLRVFHNHSTLASIFWDPPSTPSANPKPPTQGQGRSSTKISEETRSGQTTTEFRTGPTEGSGPGRSATDRNASITSLKAHEVLVKEDLPFSLQLTVTYRVSTKDEVMERDSLNQETLLSEFDSSSDSILYLEVERSVLTLRPMSFLVKMTDGPIIKTKNLMFVLEEMGTNGGYLEGALGALWMREGDDVGKGDGNEVEISGLEKRKAD